MTNSGLRTVDYASGWSNRVDVAARRAIMTGLSQLTGKVNEMNAEELGTDTFEVTRHSGARPSHQVWQGKWYTKEELISVCGLGTVTGLHGASCYHDYYPVIPGISEPSYTAEELEELNRQENTPVKYGDKEYTKYEALQRQRRLETTMRTQRQKIKLLKEGGADEDDIIAARARYRGTSAEYTRFSEAMKLPQQRQRVTVDGLGSIGQGKWKKKVEKINLDDIIELSDKEISKHIKSGRVNRKILAGKQGKHIKGHNNYVQGKSYLTISIEEAQKIVNKYAGSGILLRTSTGKWKKQEVVFLNSVIGVDIDNITNIPYEAEGFKIHYSNGGVHIVPKRR